MNELRQGYLQAIILIHAIYAWVNILESRCRSAAGSELNTVIANICLNNGPGHIPEILSSLG
jgi:hypothetical protein